MNDRELLEAAAKAAGIEIDYTDTNGGGRFNTGFDAAGNAVLDWHNHKTWNPLTDDGDVLRLAVSLRITVEQCLTETKVSAYVLAGLQRNHCTSISGAITREQATRHAIVSVAAEIGRSMP